MDIDETNCVSHCAIYFRGAKCEIRLDRHFKTVELSGIGFETWREERLPRFTQLLFKRILTELDSQDILGSIKPSDLSSQQPKMGENCNKITQLGNDVNDNVAPKKSDVDSVAPTPNVRIAKCLVENFRTCRGPTN